MVQLSPITKFGSGAGYEYKNAFIYAFAHTNMGHWNLCNIPIGPVSGDDNPADFGSAFSDKNESAHPGCYQIYLDRYGLNVELTSTLRTGYDRYTYKDSAQSTKLRLERRHSRLEDRAGWRNCFQGFPGRNEKVFFYAVSN